MRAEMGRVIQGALAARWGRRLGATVVAGLMAMGSYTASDITDQRSSSTRTDACEQRLRRVSVQDSHGHTSAECGLE
jgi:hypothetical protein